MVTRFGFACLALLSVAIATPLRRADAHPIHMSFTEMRHFERSRTLELSVRVFTNDFSAAAARYTRATLGADSTIDARRGTAYLLSRVRVASGTSLLTLSPCGVIRIGDMLQFCFRANYGRARNISLANTILTELFQDQVNVVQLVAGKRRTSRLFVRGDGWKVLTGQ